MGGTEASADDKMRTIVLWAVHSMHVEYFAAALNVVNIRDHERPHDLCGPMNKFVPSVLNGLALMYQNGIGSSATIKEEICRAVNLHRRGQYHHRIWCSPSGGPEDSMVFGAIDCICAQLEPRVYQGGAHSYEEIFKSGLCGTELQMRYLLPTFERMQRLEQPRLGGIVALNQLENPGIPECLYQEIILETFAARDMVYQPLERGLRRNLRSGCVQRQA